MHGLTDQLHDHNILVQYPRASSTLATSECNSQMFVDVCQTVSQILRAIHQKGHVHGDISLANILIFGSCVWLNDFGSVCEKGTPVEFVATTALFSSFELPLANETGFGPLHDLIALAHVLTAFARRTPFMLSNQTTHRLLPFVRTDDVLVFLYDLLQVEKLAAFWGPANSSHFLLSLLEEDLQHVTKEISGAAGTSAQYETRFADEKKLRQDALKKSKETLLTALGVLYPLVQRLRKAIRSIGKAETLVTSSMEMEHVYNTLINAQIG